MITCSTLILGYEYSEAAGCKTAVLTCLRGKSAEELVALSEQYFTWIPVIDAPLGGMAVMPQDHLTALLTGQYKAKAHGKMPPIRHLVALLWTWL
jgi:hypothetical protein